MNADEYVSESRRLGAPNARRACDACKRRKVRCDTESTPCANCVVSRIQCSYTIVPKKRGPKRRTQPTQGSQSAFSISGRDLLHQPVLQTRELTQGSSIENAELLTQSVPAMTPGSPRGAMGNHSSRDGSIEAVQDELRDRLAAEFPHHPPDTIADQCITLYMDHLFPVAPIIHETSIRSFPQLLNTYQTLVTQPPPGAASSPSSLILDLGQSMHIRNWTLLTALCAATAFLLPASIFPTRDRLGRHFLRASRDMLKNYQDHDIEGPDYTSLAIRYYHSNALHAVGKTRVSWHVLGEAIRLSQEMRLFDETSYVGLETLEAHLRRATFWQLYTADKSASILNNCPIALHEVCLGVEVTTLYPASSTLPLLDPRLAPLVDRLDRQIIVGFNLCQDLWMCASDIILKLDTIKVWGQATGSSPVLGTLQESVTHDHLRFVSALDAMQSNLLSVDLTSQQDDAAVAQLKRANSTQRTNLLVTYHCLRLVLLHKFSKSGLSELLGINRDPLSIALRKTEIASDMIRVLSESSLESLQVNGEPCVEKVRRVGVTLLEIVHEVNSSSLIERAKSLFFTLLDILARLDSRVSEELDVNRGF